MSRMSGLAAAGLLSSAMLGTACHAKFKKYAPTIDSVDVQVLTSSGPSVYLGRLDSGEGLVADIVDTVVNVSQAVNEAQVANRIAAAVEIGRTNEALERGFARTLQDGPPFPYVEDSGAARVQMEVVSYGMQAPYLGAQASFNYDIRVRIYKGAERVYSARTGCDTAAGYPDELSQALDLVNNRQQIDALTDKEIQDAFDAVAQWCGQEIVRKLRKHAG